MIPRAIRSPVFAMARPRRPAAELAAVRAAADIVRAERGLNSAKAIGVEVARRVVEEMLADLQRDEFEVALAKAENQFAPSPIYALATCPEINSLDAFVQRRTARLQGRSGRYLSAMAQAAERQEIAVEVRELLAQRYARQLRC